MHLGRRVVCFMAASAAGIYLAVSISQADITKPIRPPTPKPPRPVSFDRVVRSHAETLFEEGKTAFRFDTFGNQDFGGGALRLHEAVEAWATASRRAPRSSSDSRSTPRRFR